MLKKSLPWVSAVAVMVGLGAAQAADAPLPRDWSGFYAGIHVGVATGIESSLETRASNESYDSVSSGQYQCLEDGQPTGIITDNPADCFENSTNVPVFQEVLNNSSSCTTAGLGNPSNVTSATWNSGQGGRCTINYNANISGSGSPDPQTIVTNGQNFYQCVVGGNSLFFNNASTPNQNLCASQTGGSPGNQDAELITTSVLTSAQRALSQASNSDDMNFLAGINAGYNMQHGAFVFGLEADLSAMSDGEEDLESSADSRDGVLEEIVSITRVSEPYINTSAKGEFGVSNVATLRARLGYDIDGTWLPFITGGLAWGQVSTEGSVTYSGDGVILPCEVCEAAVMDHMGGAGFSETRNFGGTDWEMGWTLGAGVNYRVAENAFIGLTYLYIDLGEHSISDSYSRSYLVGGEGTVLTGSVDGEVDATFHTVRLSFDVLF